MEQGVFDRFLAYAAQTMARATFDSEERDWKLERAEMIRNLLTAARSGGPWVPMLHDAFPLRRENKFELPTRVQTGWINGWASSDPGSLQAALQCFVENEDAVQRFDGFVRAAGASSFPDARRPGLMIAFGSWLNFALSPETLPVMRVTTFDGLIDLLGRHSRPYASAVDRYAKYLEFARAVETELRGGGIAVRDMLDTHSLIFIAVDERDFWSGADTGAHPVEPRRAIEPEDYLAIGGIYRNEAPYLREWIEFHRLVGVGRFVLYNNESEDEHEEVLAPYVEEGIVEVHDWPLAPIQGGQYLAYEDCLRRYRDRFRWVALLDIDEFLFSPTLAPLPEVLREFERWPGVGVNWTGYGTNGLVDPPDGLVIESYLRRARADTVQAIKHVVDPTRAVRVRRPGHIVQFDSGLAVDENQRPIRGYFTKSTSISKLRVNHYQTKSLTEYRRKRSTKAERERTPRRSEEEVIAASDDEYDDAITAYVPALRDAIERMQR